MPTVTTGDIIRVRVWCQDSAQASVNTVDYLVISDGATPSTDLQVATAIDTLVHAPFKTIINNITGYVGVQAQIQTPGGIVYSAASSVLFPGIGSAGAIALPKQVAGLISWGTPLAGRRFRGRMYMPFPAAADDVGDGKPTAAYQTKILNLGLLFNGFTDTGIAGSSTFAQVITHRAGKTPIPAPTGVIDVSASAKWATQRKRGDFGRVNASPI